MRYDVVAFGDVVTDCFIRLKEAEVHCDVNPEECELCVKFGQKVPFESATEVRAVGNATNAAAAVARLGLSSAAAVELGDDDNGRACVQTMLAAGIATEFVGVHAGLPTNYHYVLQYGAERTILVKHEHYPRVLPHFSENPAWLYLTSLGEDTVEYQKEIARYATEHGVKLAFQPGTFQILAGKEALADVYAATTLLICNKEEAKQILGTNTDDVVALLTDIRALGPKIAIVTDGIRGAHVQEEDTSVYHVPVYPDPAPPVSRTGAGDATASTAVAYMVLGLPAHEALLHGVVNAAFVVQKLGAQAGLLTREELDRHFAEAPADFKAEKVA